MIELPLRIDIKGRIGVRMKRTYTFEVGARTYQLNVLTYQLDKIRSLANLGYFCVWNQNNFFELEKPFMTR